jgi:hypothetical protein
MTEHAFTYPKIGRRNFLARAGILSAAAATGWGASAAAPHATWLKPVPAGDARIGQLKRLRSAQVAERAFGPLDWSAVRAAPFTLDSPTILNDERIYFIPVNSRDGAGTLLVLSQPWESRERRALATAAARSGDRSLFNDDLVVALDRRGEPELRWSTVDGRTLVARHATGELRHSLGVAGHKLARGVGHPLLALASGIAACGDAGAELRRGERLPLALYRAGAVGKRRVRRCGAPLARR